MTTTEDHMFDFLELDPLPAPRPPRDAAPVPVPAPDVSPGVRSEAALLADAEARLAQDHGIDVKGADDGTLFAPGTPLYEAGVEKLRRAQAELDALPTVTEAARAHEARIAEEDRRDTTITLSDFRVDPRGELRVFSKDRGWGSHKSALADHAFGQLAARCGTPNVNRALGAQTEPPALLRTRRKAVRDETGALVVSEDREAYAIQNGGKRGYKPFDTDRVLWAAARAMPGDLKAQVTYDPETTTLRARLIAQAPIDVPAFNGVGRVHRLGLDLWSADNGTMSIRARPFMLRVRCKNATLVVNAGHRGRIRHVGTVAGVEAAVKGALEKAASMVEEFRDLWARKAQEWYLDRDNGARLDTEEAIRRLVHFRHLPLNGMSETEAADAYVQAYRAEAQEGAPHSVMGVVMAVQRAAHETTWRTRWADTDTEEAATALLYNRVLALPSMEA